VGSATLSESTLVLELVSEDREKTRDDTRDGRLLSRLREDGD
jgi:hypothetical protein